MINFPQGNRTDYKEKVHGQRGVGLSPTRVMDNTLPRFYLKR